MAANVIDTSSIVEKTVFLSTSYGLMGNSKKVSNSVINGASNTRILRIQKSLLDSKELEAIRTSDGKMRNYLYNVCLPFDMGIQLLPIQLLESVYDRLTAYTDERQELVDAFCTAYPQLCIEAQAELQKLAVEIGVPYESLYNPSDYPSVDVVRQKFSFEFRLRSFAVPEALKKTAFYDAEKSKAMAQIQSAADEITLLMRETLLGLVDHLKTALEPSTDGKPKRLFASSVTNIQDFLDTFKARNITNDEELEALVSDVSNIIHPKMYADVLKKDDSLKTSVHEAMTDVSAKLSAMVETVPGRKFKK